LSRGEKSQDSLVLIGSTNNDYVDSLKAFIQNKQSVWTAWNFRVRNEWRNVILNRIRTEQRFSLYFYLSKKLGGSGTVESVALVSDIRMSDTPIASPDPDLTNTGEEDYPTDDFKSYTWFKHSAVDPVGPFDIRAFSDISTEEPTNPSQLIASFAYAFLSEERRVTPQAIEETSNTTAAISVERDLRKYLVPNLTSLEPGLNLYRDQDRDGEEYPIDAGRMRIDILAKDQAGDYVIIELKAGVADSETFGQISAYIGWVKRNLAKDNKVRGIIVANDFEERVKYAAQSVSNIELKRYGLKFEFNDEEV
jgi:hypothetical protein